MALNSNSLVKNIDYLMISTFLEQELKLGSILIP